MRIRSALVAFALGLTAVAFGTMAPSPADAASVCSSATATAPNWVSGNVAYWVGTSGNDTIKPTSGSWQIVSIAGHTGNDTLCGDLYKTNFLYGDAGNDLLYGGGNSDHLVGGPGDDYARGEAGNDTYDAEARIADDDIFHGGGGYDQVINCTTVPGCPPIITYSSVEAFVP